MIGGEGTFVVMYVDMFVIMTAVLVNVVSSSRDTNFSTS
jgi:hypothetical protein